MRILSLALATIAIVFLAFYVWMRRRRGEDSAVKVAREAGEIARKYGAMIVEVKTVADRGFGESIVPVNTIEDLMKVGQGLLKPVHHASGAGKHVYWVYDDHKRYEFSVTPPKAIPESSEGQKN